jgi:hypothetical protein
MTETGKELGRGAIQQGSLCIFRATSIKSSVAPLMLNFSIYSPGRNAQRNKGIFNVWVIISYPFKDCPCQRKYQEELYEKVFFKVLVIDC